MEYLHLIFACTDTPHSWLWSFTCCLLSAGSWEPHIKGRISRWVFYYYFLKITLLLRTLILQVLLSSGLLGCSRHWDWRWGKAELRAGAELKSMPFVPSKPGAFWCIAVLNWLYINCIHNAAWLAFVLTALARVQSWCASNGHWDCTVKHKSFLAVRLH